MFPFSMNTTYAIQLTTHFGHLHPTQSLSSYIKYNYSNKQQS